MKNKVISFLTIALMAVNLVACGSNEATDQVTNQGTEEENTDAVAEQENSENASEADNTETSSTDLTFEDLSKYTYEFCSGAGGWSTDFCIEKDGYFHGTYHDSDMGDTGDGYENGTYYFADFTGHFADLEKIDEYTYQMTLQDISYADELGTEEILDNMLYVYTDAYGLEGTSTFKIYLPGKPISEISEEVMSWLSMANDSETELTMLAIENVDMEEGIYTYERMAPLEDAQTALSNAQASIDYYTENSGETMVEMEEAASMEYQVADDCLNYIWNLVKYNTSEEEFQTILEEQRAWLTERDEKTQEIYDSYEGGSMAALDATSTKAGLTMERCQALIEYLK